MAESNELVIKGRGLTKTDQTRGRDFQHINWSARPFLAIFFCRFNNIFTFLICLLKNSTTITIEVRSGFLFINHSTPNNVGQPPTRNSLMAKVFCDWLVVPILVSQSGRRESVKDGRRDLKSLIFSQNFLNWTSTSEIPSGVPLFAVVFPLTPSTLSLESGIDPLSGCLITSPLALPRWLSVCVDF